VRKADLFLLLKNRHKNQRSRSHRVMPVLKPVAKTVAAVFALAILGTLFIAGLTYAKIAVDLPSIQVLPVMLDPETGELLQYRCRHSNHPHQSGYREALSFRKS
jgi:hypothetical protein